MSDEEKAAQFAQAQAFLRAMQPKPQVQRAPAAVPSQAPTNVPQWQQFQAQNPNFKSVLPQELLNSYRQNQPPAVRSTWQGLQQAAPTPSANLPDLQDMQTGMRKSFNY